MFLKWRRNKEKFYDKNKPETSSSVDPHLKEIPGEVLQAQGKWSHMEAQRCQSKWRLMERRNVNMWVTLNQEWLQIIIIIYNEV